MLGVLNIFRVFIVCRGAVSTAALKHNPNCRLVFPFRPGKYHCAIGNAELLSLPAAFMLFSRTGSGECLVLEKQSSN